MQKSVYWYRPSHGRYRAIIKTLLVMKLIIVLLTAGLLQVHASGLAQKVTINANHTDLKTVLKWVERQTGYGLFYNAKLMQSGKPLSLHVKDMPLQEFMELLLKGRPLSFKINEKNILIKEKVVNSEFTILKPVFLQITGVVRQGDGSPLIGATVRVKGKSISTITDEAGRFSLTASIGDLLVVSYVGSESKEIKLTEQNIATSINISLNPSNIAMDEVVVINKGYYTTTEISNTGSVSIVNSKVIEKQPVSNPLLALQGRMSGVYIQQTNGTPGSSVSVQIRGRNSIAASNNPFYVIDGVPFVSQGLTSSLSVSSSVYGNEGASPFNTIAPEDIESIEVLKDADATAIYGSRGANGVVLITTKKGKSGKTKVDINSYYGISRVSRKMKMMNTTQYLDMRRAAIANDGVTLKITDYDLNGTWDQNRYTNWQDELIGGTAKFGNYKISLSGGNENNQFLLSGTYHHQGTVYPGNNGYNRSTVHFSSSHNSADKKLKATVSAIYSNDKTDWVNIDLTSRSITLPPNAPAIYNHDGSLNWANSSWVNPLRELENKYLSVTGNLIANTVLSYKPFQELEIKANLGYNNMHLNDHSYTPATRYYDPAQQQTAARSLADYNTSSLKSWIAEPQVNFNKTFGFGTVSLLTGMSFQNQEREQLLVRGIGFSSDALIENVAAANSSSIREYSNTIYKYSGLYGRVNYSLNDKYIFNFVGRRDGSSRFGPGKQFANFGSVGAAWIFSSENALMKNLPFLSFGKLRASYGSSGNDQIGDYQFLNTYASSIAYNGINSLYPVRLWNPDFAWEVNRKLEVGLDLGFLNNRIRATIAYYRNRSSNQLINYPLASTTGFMSVRNNLNAIVQNTGLELELNTINCKTKDFYWETSFNLTVPKNKLVAFPLLENSSYASQYIIGEPLTIGRAYRFKGVNPNTGLFEVEDANNDGVISYSDDRQTITRRGQQFYGGISNQITYKGFELSFLFQFVQQKLGRYIDDFAPGIKRNQPESAVGKFWNKPGDITSFPILTTGQNYQATSAYNNYYYSDATLMDASFVRLKSLALSYRIKKMWGNKTARFYFQGQNLFTITNYFGLDPETRSSVLPPLQTLTLGLQLTF